MDAYCYRCEKDRDVSTCGKCRKVTKSHLVKMLFNKKNRVFLHEGNRNTEGPTEIHTGMTRRTIAYQHQMGMSYRDLAKKYHISATSVWRYYRQFEHNWK